MISTPEENPVILTPEENAQIDEATLRLSKIQMETVINTRLVNSLRNDCNRLSKEKEYQEKVLVEIKGQVVKAQNQFNEFNEANNVLALKLSNLNKEIVEKNDAQIEKDKELKDREDNIEKKEQELLNEEEKLNQRKVAHNKERESFKEDVTNLKNVIKDLNVYSS